MKKNHIFWYLIMFSLVLFVFSCTKLENREKAYDFSKYSEVGKLHNDGLSYVFNTFNGSTKSITGTTLSFDNLIATVRKFLVKIGENAPSDNLSFYKINIDFNATRSKDMLKELPLSPIEKEYFNDLIVILYKYETIEVVSENILMLQKRIVDENKLSDLDPILYACEVTKYSYAYWHDNMEYWINKFSDNPTTKGFWSELRDAFIKSATMDGAGAAVGAIAGGVGALPGALGTSLLYCANEVVNSF